MEFYVLKLTGGKKQVIKKSNNLDETIKYISESNLNAVYLDNILLTDFLNDDTREAGTYLLCEEQTDKLYVYCVSNVVTLGYFYNSEYKRRDLVNEYELVESRTE